MRNLTMLAVSMAALFSLTACPGKIPGVGGGGGTVDPNSCGDYASVNDAGRKLHSFLDATANLQTTVKGMQVEVRTGCDAMAKELGISPSGDDQAVCKAVLDELKADMHAGIKADAKLSVEYTPAVCTVDVDVAASASAECEASGSASADVKCEGTCTGTCNGACDGKCSSGSSSECNGTCDGTCGGSCSGGCNGSADVQGSAECKAQAEVDASAKMTCTEPKFEVTADASIVVDKPKTDKVIAALKAGMGHILTVEAKTKPLTNAVKDWVAAANGVVSAGRDLASQFKDQALCLTAQIKAAADAIASIQASFSFSVNVSVEASATAGAGAG